MRHSPATHRAPADADARRRRSPVVCYPTDALPEAPLELYRAAREQARELHRTVVPPRRARCATIPRGLFFRVSVPEGPQVGDLNLWNAADLGERFYSGKTRALHGTHVSTGDRLWSSFPHLRPMATIVEDTLDWYGTDPDGGRIHDVIGTRCDPYTARLLSGVDYHHCCHSNLVRALVAERGLAPAEAESRVHDVLNVFMCTGFTAEGRYFMKASPARRGDFVEFFAEIDLLVALSTCPGGDCGAAHSSGDAVCHPLDIVVSAPENGALDGWRPPGSNAYPGTHGLE